MSYEDSGIGYIFCKIDNNAETPEEIKAQIAIIDAIIAELLNTALKSVQTGNIAEYELDTGQSKQRVKYTSVGSVMKAVRGWKELRKYFANDLLPRNVRLMDVKNFRHNGYF